MFADKHGDGDPIRAQEWRHVFSNCELARGAPYEPAQAPNPNHAPTVYPNLNSNANPNPCPYFHFHATFERDIALSIVRVPYQVPSFPSAVRSIVYVSPQVLSLFDDGFEAAHPALWRGCSIVVGMHPDEA